jgi:hypothetical protein
MADFTTVSMSSILQLSPILATLLMPPLSRQPTQGLTQVPLLADLEELLFEFHCWLEKILKREFNMNLITWRDKMVFSEKTFKAGRKWEALTHMMVHGTYEHLGHNLLSFILAATGPLHKVGPVVFWTAFLLGGAGATLNSPLKSIQDKYRISQSIETPWLSNVIPRSWDVHLRRWQHEASSHVSNVVRPHRRYIGCSAGVNAIVGLNFGIVVENLIGWLYGSTSNFTG